MIPARVVLLRHGATVGAGVCQGARHDTPLSLDGQRQAVAAVERVGAFDRCVVSPLGRAQATAAALGCATEVDPRWRERDFGAWEGRSWSEVIGEIPSDAHDDMNAYLAFTPSGGETWTEVAARVTAALEELAGREGTTLVVTHGGPIRVAVTHALAVPLERAVRFNPLHGDSTWLTRIDGMWQLDRFGW